MRLSQSFHIAFTSCLWPFASKAATGSLGTVSATRRFFSKTPNLEELNLHGLFMHRMMEPPGCVFTCQVLYTICMGAVTTRNYVRPVAVLNVRGLRACAKEILRGQLGLLKVDAGFTCSMSQHAVRIQTAT